jgi:hypothetical protein
MIARNARRLVISFYSGITAPNGVDLNRDMKFALADFRSVLRSLRELAVDG